MSEDLLEGLTPDSVYTPEVEEQIKPEGLDEVAEGSEEDTEDITGEQLLQKLKMEDALFTGGPTRAWVEEQKLKYPKSEILLLLFANTGVIYRTMTRFEWRHVTELIRKIENPDERDDIIFSKITLFPDCGDRSTILDLPAGMVGAVLQEFYQFAGFSPITTTIKL